MRPIKPADLGLVVREADHERVTDEQHLARLRGLVTHDGLWSAGAVKHDAEQLELQFDDVPADWDAAA